MRDVHATKDRGRRIRMNRWRSVTATIVAVLSLVTGLAVAAPAAAAGTAVLTVSLSAVTAGGAPVTSVGSTGLAAQDELRYRVSYSCSVTNCDDAVIKLSPGPLDPNYGAYRHLLFSSWTPPFVGAVISGDDTTGRVASLGTVTAGTSGSFTVVYQWANRGSVSVNSPAPASFFPNGFPIVMSATGTSSTTAEPSVHADAPPVTWKSEIRTPTLAVAGSPTVKTGTDYTYSVRMASNCLTVQESAPKGDARYTCARDYGVTLKLPVQARYVESSNDGVYDAVAHSVTWTQGPRTGADPAIGWHRAGSSSVWAARTVTVQFEAPRFSPVGDPDYCQFTESVTASASTDVTYLGLKIDDIANVRSATGQLPVSVSCMRPFGKAVFTSKLSSFDGTARLTGNTISPVVVQPDADPNLHYWDVSVGNQANVPGVAVIDEPNLAVLGTRPSRIEPRLANGTVAAAASVSWRLNTGQTGTSTGAADAPTGTWFVSATVTSPSLAGPNLLEAQTAQTAFSVRYHYRVAGDAPVGQNVANTATAKMTYPENPELTEIDLGSRSHSIQFVAPFGRVDASKSTTYSFMSGGNPVVTLPTTGSVAQQWRILVRNTSNVPAVAVIDEPDLGGKPGRVNAVAHTGLNYRPGVDAQISYTLNTGVTGTARVPFNAPVGTWITALRVTSMPLEPVNAFTSQSATTSYYELRLGYDVTAATPLTSWKNTAAVTLTYPGMGVANSAPIDATSTVRYATGATTFRATISAPVVQGGGSAVPGRDVTYKVSGVVSGVPEGIELRPQYVFLAPAGWIVMPNRASFPTGSVPAGVTFDYRTVTVAGVQRQAVVAAWPEGTVFDPATAWPELTVVAQPSFAAAVDSRGTATAWVGDAGNGWTVADATFTGPVTDTTDVDGDGVRTEGFATVNAAAVTVGSAEGLAVTKEICRVDLVAADGCEWIADPSIVVPVSTTQSGIKYRVTLQNVGNTALSNVVAYDVLPYVGDTGMIASTASTPRGSTFAELLDAVTAKSANVTLSYSASTNPLRPEVYPGAPGAIDDWTTAGAGKQAIRARVTGSLAPGATASFVYSASVAGGAAADAIACNSVAIDSSGTIPVEPPAVCASTQEADLTISVPERLPLQAGRPGIVPFVVDNLGGSQQASRVGVTLAIPEDLTVTELRFTGWSCTADGPAPVAGPASIVCAPVDGNGAPRSIERGTPAALNLPVIVDATATSVCVDGVVSGGMHDPNLDNNEASGCQTVVGAVAGGLTVDKADDRTTVQAGDTYTYTIRVGNGLVGETVRNVVLVDELPAGLEYVSATGSPLVAGRTLTWTFGQLDPTGKAGAGGDNATGGTGSTAQVSVTVRVVRTGADAIENVAVASAVDPADPNGTLGASGSDTNSVRRLSITKTSDATADIGPGAVVTYTVTVTNAGTGDYTTSAPARVTDQLAGVFGNADWNDDARASRGTAPVLSADDELVWSGALPVGVSVELQYSVTVVGAGDGLLTNTACVPLAQTAPGADACATVSTPMPKLRVQKSADRLDLPEPGEQINYTVTLTNEGGGNFTTAHPASMTDDLSDVLDDADWNDDAASTVGSAPDWDAGILSWSGALAAGASTVITYSVTYTGSGDLVLGNTACVPAVEVAAGRLACASTSVPAALVNITKTVDVGDGEAVNAGDELVYTITVENVGGAAGTVDEIDRAVNLLDDAEILEEPDVDVASVTLDGFDEDGLLVIGGTIAPHTTATITYSVRVLPFDERGDHVLRNFLGSIPTGGVCAEDDDRCTSNPVRHLSVTKTASLATAATGDSVEYEVTIANDGGADLLGAPLATMSDDLAEVLDDASFVVGSLESSVGTAGFQESVLIWSGPLAAGASATVRYSVTVHNGGDHSLNNTAVVRNPGDESVEDAVETLLSDVRVEKTASVADGNVVTGQEITYRITVRNHGTATGVVNLLDDLSAVLDDADVVREPVASGAVLDARRAGDALRVTGDLDPDAEATVEYTVVVRPFAERGDSVVRNVVSDAGRPAPFDCADALACTRHTVPHLSVVKASDAPAHVATGTVVTYRVVVTNDGAGTADGRVSDRLDDVLDDARWNGDAKASRAGAAGFGGRQLQWAGELTRGQSVELTYSVTVTGRGDGRLVNAAMVWNEGEGEQTATVSSTVRNPPAALAVTGAEVLGILAIAMILLVLGALLLLRRRRRLA